MPSPNLPIIPSRELGGVRLGDRIEAYTDWIEDDRDRNGQRVALLCDGKVAALTFNGVVTQISALEGYSGLLKDEIGLGMPISILTDDKDWHFSEKDDGFVHGEESGVVVRVNLEDATLGEIEAQRDELIISEISVFIQ